MRLTPFLRLRQSTALLESLVIPAASKPNPSSSIAYHVARTQGNNFPVFKRKRAGGTFIFTQVRRVQGDGIQLKEDLRATLGVPAENMAVNPMTNVINIKVSFCFAASCE